jgi:GNAT superfamily N-acetyltransferase
MATALTIRQATATDTPAVARMAGELLDEIMRAIGEQAFNFDLDVTTTRLHDFLQNEKYFVFVAEADGDPAGFIAMYESHALYAEGAFGTIAELFVRPRFRSRKTGERLIDEARSFGRARGWTRLEVTTPPLPRFDRTLAFYEGLGFSITGGRKLKTAL